MLDRLRQNQPPVSTTEFFIIFFASDIPLYIGKAIAIGVFAFSEWPALGMGLAFAGASIIAYFAIRPEVLSK